MLVKNEKNPSIKEELFESAIFGWITVFLLYVGRLNKSIDSTVATSTVKKLFIESLWTYALLPKFNFLSLHK